MATIFFALVLKLLDKLLPGLFDNKGITSDDFELFFVPMMIDMIFGFFMMFALGEPIYKLLVSVIGFFTA